MRIPRLSAFLVAAALASAPSAIAFADPAPTAQTTPTTVPSTTDAGRYAAREVKDTAVTKFEGGGEVLVIGTSGLAIVLLVVILVILL